MFQETGYREEKLTKELENLIYYLSQVTGNGVFVGSCVSVKPVTQKVRSCNSFMVGSSVLRDELKLIDQAIKTKLCDVLVKRIEDLKCELTILREVANVES